jgi:hypothetical protein
MQQFRQWNQMNVDYGAQKMLILVPDNITWNPNGPSNLKPIYQIIHTGLSTRIMRHKIKVFW